MKYYEEERRDAEDLRLERAEYFRGGHPGLRGFVESPEVLDVVGAAFGEAPQLFKEKINYKLPGGTGFEPHQDVQAGWDRYCATHLTLVVHLDAADERNGCLEFASGAHRDGLLGESWRPLDGAALAGLDFEPVSARPGDALLFGSYAPHRSGPNASAAPRRVLYLTYNPASEGDHYEQYFADKRASFPPEVERQAGREYRYRV